MCVCVCVCVCVFERETKKKRERGVDEREKGKDSSRTWNRCPTTSVFPFFERLRHRIDPDIFYLSSMVRFLNGLGAFGCESKT